MKGTNLMICPIVLLLSACNSAPNQQLAGPLPSLPTSKRDTVNVLDYGALGDGRHDDTAAFRTALAALGPSGGVVRVPAGTYPLTPIRGIPDRAIDLSGRSNITISGDGPNKTSLLLAPSMYRGDTHIVYLIDSSNIILSDLALDGNRTNASFSDEQNHCVEVRPGSTDLVIERVRFHHCRGDGIRLIGSADPLTQRITIRESSFEENGRSGIAVQRGVRHLTILNTLSSTIEGGRESRYQCPNRIRCC